MQLSKKIKNMLKAVHTKFTQNNNKVISGVIVSAMLFSSVPTCVFAQDEEESLEPTVIESTVVESTTEETTINTTVTETTTENVDENVTSIPTDETEPTSNVTEEAEEPPIETTVPSTETAESTETTIESTDPIETTVPSTESTEETTVVSEEKENKITVATSYDNYFELISKLPDGVERIIVDTEADLSSLDVDAGVYYDGTYILVFNTQAKYNTAIDIITKAGYTYAIDGTVTVCADPIDGNTTDNSTKINPNAKTKIAVIDTGSNKANEKYSVIGDSVADDNGHGTDMCNYILSETNDAYIISIKALDKNGNGQMSDVYAAVQMAEDLGVDYILMSISIRDGGKYEAFKDLIKNTKATVIASAGNNGADAKKYLPASIDNVITIGAKGDNHVIMPFSNYGTCVEYYMPYAKSTSEAAATAAGKIIANTLDKDAASFGVVNNSNKYYYEGSEEYFEVNAGLTGTPTVTFLTGSDLNYSRDQYFSRIKNYCESYSLSDADSSWSWARNYFMNSSGFHYGHSRYYDGGCIDFALSAVAYAAKNNENADFTSGTGFHIVNTTGCSSLMRSAGYGTPNAIGYDLPWAWTNNSADITKAQRAADALYDYVTTYAEPGDIVMFGATWDSSTPWHHVGIYAGSCSASQASDTMDRFAVPEGYSSGNSSYDSFRGELYFAGAGADTIVIYESSISSNTMKQAHLRAINGADFYMDRNSSNEGKLFDTVVILKVSAAPTTTQLTLQKSSSDTSISNSSSSYSLAGTTYVLYDGTTPVATFVMDANGNTSTVYTTAYNKTYTLKETVAGTGFKLDTTTYTVTVSSTGVVSISGGNGASVGSSGTINVLKVQDIPATAGITMTKAVASDSTYVTSGNSCYSLDNTTYKVYASDADAQADRNALGTIVFGANGAPKSNTVPSNLKYGVSYYIKETQAGKGMLVDGSTYRVRADGANTGVYAVKEEGSSTYGTNRSLNVSNGQISIAVYDIPVDDPLQIRLSKVNSSGQKISATLAGVEYTLEYYAQDIAINASTSGITPTATYRITGVTTNTTFNFSDFATQANGVTLVSGNGSYFANIYSQDNDAYFPLGTYRIYESKAPIGFETSSEIFRWRLYADSTSSTGAGTQFRNENSNGHNFFAYTSTTDALGITNDDNPIIGYYTLTKAVNNNTFSKYGYNFSIYNGTTLIATGVSQNDGKVLWTYKADIKDSETRDSLINTTTYKLQLPVYDNINGTATKINYEVRETVKTVTYASTGISYTNHCPTGWTDHSTYYSKNVTLTPRSTTENTFNDTITNVIDTTAFTVRKADISATNSTARTFNFTVYYRPTANGTRTVFDTFTLTTSGGVASKTYSGIPTGYYEVVETNLQSGWTSSLSSTMYNGSANGSSGTITVTNSVTPTMSTQLKCNNTNSQVIGYGNSITMRDVVSYNNLTAGTYYVTGTLIDKSTGEPLKINGNNVTAQATFTIASKTNSYGQEVQQSGTVNVDYTINTTGLAGKTLVAFEEIRTGSYTGTVILEHKNINDTAQTVWMPSIKTTLTDDTTKAHIVAYSDSTVTVTDMVACSNLVVGQAYTISGTLYNKATGASMNINGTKEFTATAASQNVPVTYTINRSQVDDVVLVAYETLKVGNTTVAIHNDINDNAQTVYIPKITTVLRSPIGATSHIINTGVDSFSIVDRINYTNLPANTSFKLVSVLMDADTQQPFVDANGQAVTLTQTVQSSGSGNGYWLISFDFDADIAQNKTLVAYEQLIISNGSTDVVVAAHEDMTSFDQSVFAPAINTTLYDKNLTSDKDTARSMKNITLVDDVALSNLVPNQKYTLTSTLVIKNGTTGTELTTKSTTFTASAKTQTVSIEFTGIDAVAHEGETFVCYETLSFGNYVVAEHKNINDEAQTVHIPKIRTTLINVATNSHIMPTVGTVTLRDTITFTNLIPNKSYTVSGELMFTDGTSTGVTASKVFKPATANGTTTLDFTVDASILQGKTIVAFEDLLLSNVTIATHADLTDEDQTVYGPKISTSLVDADTNDRITSKSTNVKLIDTVTYENLVPDVEYTMTGVLYNKATGEPVKVGGTNVTGSKKFTPSTPNGTVKIEFTIDTTNFAGETFVAFETLTYGTVEIANHNDINDIKQTVHVPDIATTFYDVDLQAYKNSARSYENITLIDEVKYTNLIPGKEYTLTGTIMVKDTTPYALKDASGSVITVTKTFTPETADGTEKITFTGINGKLLEGKTIVAFETLTYEGIDIVVHANIDDKNQTVQFPKIRTQLTSVDTTDSVVPTNTEVELVDKVTYENLVIGEHYIITGKLVFADGSGDVPNVTVIPVSFTAESANGTAEVTFKFNSSVLKNKTIVAFEDLMVSDINVASHADLTDENQTVYIPEIHTTLLDKATDKHVSAQGTVTVIDAVACNNLVVGKEYTLDGTLMNKKTGEALKNADGSLVTATITWTAEAKDETKKLTFTFDSSLLEDGTGSIVAFESLKHNNIEITTHNDLKDFDQSVYVPSVYTELFDEAFVNTPELRALTRNFTSVDIVDHVYFKNLTPGYTYTLYSGLYIREDSDGVNNVPFCDAEGAQYAKTITFDPEDTTIVKELTVDPDTGAISGMIEVKYTINATLLSGKHIVAFESLDIAGGTGTVSLVSHADPKNDYETISVPEIGTTAKDKADGDQMLDGTKTQQTVVDTIAYSGLIPGQEYVATGKLVIKKDYAEGEEYEYVLDKDGNVLTVSVPFTPDATNSTIDADTGAASGTVDVEFTFDASKYAGKYVVAFETVTINGIEVAVHADITDEGQTVKIPLLLHVKIAKMDGKNVKYTLKNAEITIYRALLDAEGKPIVDESGNVIYEVVKDVNGKDCIGVTDKDGILEFTVMYDEHYVYYAKETKAPRGYYINDKYFEIVPTDDRESEGVNLIPIQIVDFAIPPKTGDSMNLGLYITLAMLSAIGVCGGLFFIYNKKKKTDNC